MSTHNLIQPSAKRTATDSGRQAWRLSNDRVLAIPASLVDFEVCMLATLKKILFTDGEETVTHDTLGKERINSEKMFKIFKEIIN